MKITITFPRFAKWQTKRKNNRKIVLTREQATELTILLEKLRWETDLRWTHQIQAMEAVVDAQIWGVVKVNGEWVKA
jgi:hypothetical protein